MALEQKGELSQRITDSGIDLPKDRRGRTRWSIVSEQPEVLERSVEAGALVIIAEGIPLTQQNVARRGMRGLAHAISRYYPGGLTGLKSELERKKQFKDAKMHWRRPGNSEEENLQLGIANVQAGFLTSFPEFDSLFPRDEKSGKISSDKAQAAREYISGRLDSLKSFRRYVGNTPISKAECPYFGASYVEAIKKSFGVWGLDFEAEDARFSRIRTGRKGIYTDSQNERWASVNYFCKKYGISAGAVQKLAAGTELLVGRGPKNLELTLLSISALTPKIEQFQKVKVDEKSGVYTSDDGEQWAPKRYFEKRYPIAHYSIISQEHLIRQQAGRAKNNTYTTLYNISDILRELGDLINLPQIDPQTGCFIDEELRSWVILNIFFEREFNTNASNYYRNFKHLEGISGRDPRGRVRVMYLEDEVRKIIEEQNLFKRSENRKPSGYWTIQRIEQEALDFYLKHGELKYPALRREGNISLSHIINSKYEGGIRRLRKKIEGFVLEQEKESTEEANRELDKLLE
jgi:hypothetical protein